MPVNTAPSPQDDFYEAERGVTLTVGAPGVLVNDDDADDDALTAELVTPPAGGDLTLNDDGSFEFETTTATPGTYAFTYLVTDENGAATRATATIEVTTADLAFVSSINAIDDTITSFTSDPITYNVIANDESDDIDDLRLTQATPPAVGQLKVESDGTITYEPPEGWQGETTFTYTIASSSGQSDTATVTIVIGSPVVKSDSVTINSYSTIAIPVLDNDIPEDGFTLQIIGFDQPESGLVELRSDGTLAYTPAPGFVGIAEFSYQVSDEAGNTGSALVRVEVLAEAQTRGLELADELGVGLLDVDAPIEVSEETSRPSLTEDGVGLFVAAVFSQLGALQLNNLWLAMAALWAITFFGFLTIFSRRPQLWAVTDIDRHSTLDAFEHPKRGDTLFRFAPDAEGIWSTGKNARKNGIRYRQVETPAGLGWVDADKLRRIQSADGAEGAGIEPVADELV